MFAVRWMLGNKQVLPHNVDPFNVSDQPETAKPDGRLPYQTTVTFVDENLKSDATVKSSDQHVDQCEIPMSERQISDTIPSQPSVVKPNKQDGEASPINNGQAIQTSGSSRTPSTGEVELDALMDNLNKLVAEMHGPNRNPEIFRDFLLTTQSYMSTCQNVFPGLVDYSDLIELIEERVVRESAGSRQGSQPEKHTDQGFSCEIL